jgi:hypothetical protein
MPDFWRSIWRPFYFKQEAPEVNMDLQGNWGSMEALNFFSSFKAENFHYAGQYTPFAGGKISVVHNYVALNALSIRGREGACAGWVDWLYVESEDEPVIVRTELESTLPLEYYTIFEYARSTAEQFKSVRPPHLLIQGTFASDTYFLEDRTLYTIIANTEHPVSFLDIPLDSLQFEAKKASGILKVNPLAFKFAEGYGGGSVLWDAKNASLGFDIHLDKANRDLILSSLPYFESFKNPFQKESKRQSKPGFFSLTIDAKGDPSRLDTFIGSGTVMLEEEDLGRVNLLGGMSAIIPITSMSLNRAESTFSLEDSILHFPDGVVSGPTAKIMANGTYAIPNQWLDFKVRVYPLAKVPVIAQALLVLAPLSEMFSLHLEGPIDDLNWSFSHASSKQVQRRQSHFTHFNK